MLSNLLILPSFPSTFTIKKRSLLGTMPRPTFPQVGHSSNLNACFLSISHGAKAKEVFIPFIMQSFYTMHYEGYKRFVGVRNIIKGFYTLHNVPDPHKSSASTSPDQYSTEVVTAHVFVQTCCWPYCCSIPLCSTNSPFKSIIHQIHWDFNTNCNEICGFWTKMKSHNTKFFLFIPRFPISFEVLTKQPDPWRAEIL